MIDRIPYSAILIVRLLLLKDKDPEAWRIFNHLEPLLQEWKDMGSWEADQGDTVNIIREKLGMKTFSREEILKVSEVVNEAADPETACIPNVEASCVPISGIQVKKEEQVDAMTQEAEKSETKNSNVTNAVDEYAIPEPEKETIPDIVDETPVLPVHDASIDANKENTEPDRLA